MRGPRIESEEDPRMTRFQMGLSYPSWERML
jgi:hypothetical protein